MRTCSSSRRAGCAALVACLCLLAATPAAAQAVHVGDVVRFLVTNQSVDTGEAGRDRAAAAAASDTIGRALLAAVSTLPTSASSAGFVYRFNPALGTLERTSVSFGPDVVERASTSGRGRIAIGGTWQYRIVRSTRWARPGELDARHGLEPLRRRGATVRRRNPGTARAEHDRDRVRHGGRHRSARRRCGDSVRLARCRRRPHRQLPGHFVHPGLRQLFVVRIRGHRDPRQVPPGRRRSRRARGGRRVASAHRADPRICSAPAAPRAGSFSCSPPSRGASVPMATSASGGAAFQTTSSSPAR